MSSKTSLRTRRQFLNRSAWGFGSAFILPSLLASCTDHLIDPTNPIPPVIGTPPLVGAYSIDWNAAAKTIVTSCVEMIPEAGDLLGPLLDIFWPASKVDVWGQVRAQVEALVDQKIAEEVYEQCLEDLTGLRYSLGDLVDIYNSGDNEQAKSQWFSIRLFFDTYIPHFQNPSYQLPLLPLFTQLANMFIGHLRDGYFHGAEWGMNSTEIYNIGVELQGNAVTWKNYVYDVYNAQRNKLTAPYTNQTDQTQNNINNEPFFTINQYDRQMTLSVLDFAELWKFFPIRQDPNNPITVNSPLEIYSDPYGNSAYSGSIYKKLGYPPFNATNTPPKAAPTNVSVFYNDKHIMGVRTTWPGGQGANGQTQNEGGFTNPGASPNPAQIDFPLTATKYFTGARVLTVRDGQSKWWIPSGLQFQYSDGSTTNQISWGGSDDSGMLSYAGRYVSRVFVNGIDDELPSADSIVIGFMDIPSNSSGGLTAVRLDSLKSIYIKAPKERSVAAFVKAYPKLAISAHLIEAELKVARMAYWADFKSRFKK